MSKGGKEKENVNFIKAKEGSMSFKITGVLSYVGFVSIVIAKSK